MSNEQWLSTFYPRRGLMPAVKSTGDAADASRSILVPTLRVGMPVATLRVVPKALGTTVMPLQEKKDVAICLTENLNLCFM